MGAAVLHKLSSRVRFIETMQWVLAEVKADIRYQATPMAELLCKLCRKGTPPELIIRCEEACSKGTPFPEAWSTAVKAYAKPCGANAADSEQLLIWGKSLGTTDIEGQMSCCELYEAQLRTSLQAARENREKKSRMCMTLGVSAGLALVLVIL
jgi:stage III sporulation protein AB